MRFRIFPKGQRLHRRVAGWHDVRLDGMSDLLHRARGASVLDVGCNRGMVGYEFATNGASLIHGVDNYEPGILAAREVFNDMPMVHSRFEVVDLTQGPAAVAKALSGDYTQYDFVLFLAVDHKLLRLVPQAQVNALVAELADRTKQFFAYRGLLAHEYEEIFTGLGFRRVQYSELSREALGAPAVVWERA